CPRPRAVARRVRGVNFPAGEDGVRRGTGGRGGRFPALGVGPVDTVARAPSLRVRADEPLEPERNAQGDDRGVRTRDSNPSAKREDSKAGFQKGRPAPLPAERRRKPTGAKRRESSEEEGGGEITPHIVSEGRRPKRTSNPQRTSNPHQ